MVQPEGHPGYHDDEEGGDVDGDDVVGDLPPESHVHGEAAIGAGGGGHVAVAVLEAVQLEAARQEEVLDELHGLLGLPLVDEVPRSPTVYKETVKSVVLAVAHY